MNEKRNRIFISYASADQEIANRIAECLRSKNKEIWFDQIEIVWGDHIISEINQGLSTSFMGIVILSRNFFDRAMPQLELNSMVFLMNILKFRILPLYHGIDHLDLLERYPLLTNIRGEKADQDCDTLVSKLEDVLRKTAKLVNRPLEEPQAVALSKSKLNCTSEVTEIDANEMENILNDLRKDTTRSRKQATLSKLRHYSDSKRIWKHISTWEIIAYLLGSKNSEDTIHGLYVMEYMIKLSRREYPDDSNSVTDNVRERFAPQLLELIHPGLEKRISQDSFSILKMIIEEDVLSKYALAALGIAVEQIINDNEYSDYIQIYVWHFENASSQNRKILCDFMYDLTLKGGKVGERAAALYDYFIKKV